MLYKVSCHCGSVKLNVETDLYFVNLWIFSIYKRKNAKINILSIDSIISIKAILSHNVLIYFLLKVWFLSFDSPGLGIDLGMIFLSNDFNPLKRGVYPPLDQTTVTFLFFSNR